MTISVIFRNLMIVSISELAIIEEDFGCFFYMSVNLAYVIPQLLYMCQDVMKFDPWKKI